MYSAVLSNVEGWGDVAGARHASAALGCTHPRGPLRRPNQASPR